MLPCSLALTESLSSSPTLPVRQPAFDSLEFSVPSTASKRSAPSLEQAVPSSPRCRSRVFSTPQRFQPIESSRPCFVPQPFLGFPFSVFPSQKARTSLEATAPLQLSTRLPRRAAFALSPTLSPTSTPKRSCQDPKPTMSYLSANPEGSTSRSLWARAANPPRSASFTCFEAFFLLRVRSLPTQVAPRRRPIRSWVSPLQSVLPRHLEASTRPSDPKALERDQSARRLWPLTKGPQRPESLVDPSAQVGIPVEPKHPRVPVGGCWPGGDQPGPPLGGLFSSHDLQGYEQARRPWPTEYSSVSRAAFPSEEGANSPEVSASSATS